MKLGYHRASFHPWGCGSGTCKDKTQLCFVWAERWQIFHFFPKADWAQSALGSVLRRQNQRQDLEGRSLWTPVNVTDGDHYTWHSEVTAPWVKVCLGQHHQTKVAQWFWLASSWLWWSQGTAAAHCQQQVQISSTGFPVQFLNCPSQFTDL